MANAGFPQLAEKYRAIRPAPCVPVTKTRGVQVTNYGLWAKTNQLVVSEDEHCQLLQTATEWQGVRKWD
jgi:hypothetical protein